MKQEYIIIHHTASSPKTSVASVNSWHKDRKFPKSSLGYYIGYHYLIGIDYRHRARAEEEIGAHAGEEWNNKAIGICLTGNFDIDHPTEYQKTMLDLTLNSLMKKYNIPRERVILHRDTKATACPGKNITKEFIYNLIDNPMIDNAKKFEGKTIITADKGKERGKWYFVLDGRRWLIPDRPTGWAHGLIDPDVNFTSQEVIESILYAGQLNYWDGRLFKLIEDVNKNKVNLPTKK